MVEDRLEILEVNITKFVEPEVVDGGRGSRKHVLLEASLKRKRR